MKPKTTDLLSLPARSKFRPRPQELYVHLQISAENGVFGQTGPKVGSFDAGYGSSHMSRLVGKSPEDADHWRIAFV